MPKVEILKPFGPYAEGQTAELPENIVRVYESRGRVRRVGGDARKTKPTGPSRTKPASSEVTKLQKGGGWYAAVKDGEEVFKGREAEVDAYISRAE